MYTPQMKYSKREEKQLRKKIIWWKVTALDENHSSSGTTLNQALESVRGRTPNTLISDLESAINGVQDFFNELGAEIKLRRAPYNQTLYWFNRLNDAVGYLQSRDINVSWKNSGMGWAMVNKDKTDEQIFLSEMSVKKFSDVCHKLGYYGGPEIEGALKRGEIPVPIIEAVLIYDGGLGGNDYPAMAQGYKNKLHPEAQLILDQHTKGSR